MLIIFSLITLILAVIIFNFGTRYFSGNLFLGLFFVFLGVFAFYFETVYFLEPRWIAACTFGFVNPFLYLMGPSYYLSTRMMATGSTKLYKFDYLHIVPLVLMLAASMPYYLTSFENKLDTINYIRSHTDEMPPDTMIFISSKVSLFGQGLLLIAYSIISRISFVKERKHILKKEYHLNIKSEKLVNWMNVQSIMTILFYIFYFGIITIGFSMQQHDTWEELSFFRIFTKIIALSFCLILFFTPSVLYGFPKRMMENYNIPKQENTKTELLLFTEDYIKTIELKIVELVKEEKFLEDKFDRTFTAEMIQIPPHHVDYYFRNVLNIKFTDWKNELKIEYAGKLLQNGMLEKLTLERIAEMSGYRNLTTFYAAFQKQKQMTPAKYAQQFSKKIKS